MNPRGKRRALVYAVVIIIFAIMAIAYTRPLVGKAGNHVLGNSGDLLLNIYIISWTSRTMGSNPLNLFNAPMFYPNSDTLAYSDHQFLNFFIAWPALAITRNAVLAYNFLVVMSFILGAMATFLLVDHLVNDWLGGLAAGIIFGFPMYKLAHIEHSNLLSTWPIPLALLFLHLFTERKKPIYALLFSFFTVCVFLSAWSYGFFFALALLVYLVVLLVQKRREVIGVIRRRIEVQQRRRVYRWVVTLALSFVLTIALVLPFALPYLRVRRDDPGFTREYGDVEAFSADLRDYLAAPPTNWVWGRITEEMRNDGYRPGGPPERVLFAGILPLLMAIGGLIYLTKNRTPRNRFTLAFYVSLAVIAWIMSLGLSLYVFGHRFDVYMPYRLLYHYFPGFKAIRTPTRMMILVVLSLAVLGGFGIRWLRGKLAGRISVKSTFAVIALILVLLAVEMMSYGLPAPTVPSSEAEWPAAYRWLDTREGDAVTVVMPLGTYGTLSPVQLEPWRIYYSTANWKKLVNGYSGYTPDSYREAMLATADFPSVDSLDYLRGIGVEYVLVEGERYSETEVRRILGLSERDEGFELEGIFGSDIVFLLR